MSGARTRGVAYGMFLVGSSSHEIANESANEVVKSDGLHPCQQSVASLIAEMKASGGVTWGPGTRHSLPIGRPRATPKLLDRQKDVV